MHSNEQQTDTIYISIYMYKGYPNGGNSYAGV